MRKSAAEALGNLGSPKAIPGLLNALQDEDSSFVRRSAAEALGKLGSHETIPGLRKAIQASEMKDSNEDSDVRRVVAERLGELDSPVAIPRLLQALEDEDFLIVVSAGIALGGLINRFPAELLKALEDKNSNMRKNAALALRHMDSQQTISGLIKALKDENSGVRCTVAETLGELGSPEVIPELLQTLKDKDSNVRRNAAVALGKLSSPEAIPRLLSALQDQDSSVHRSVVEALGQIKQDKAAYILPDLLALIPTKSGKYALRAISNIQQNCRFYNYEIFHKQLPPVVIPQQSTNYSIWQELQQIKQGVQKVSETPKQDFSGATITGNGINFASNQGSQYNIRTQNNYSADSKIPEALKSISQLLENVRKKNPQASDAEILDIITKGFETMPQKNPKQWQHWRNTLSIVFAGGIESIKWLLPAAGIPIEVIKRFHEIYNRKLGGR
ncbi:MAG: HEAT repeat domain-containing protein [Symploca sp. SIO2D2]|nr:HEAT repeat domain-containing protein [Symploca sp. SIO2D2]